MASMKKICPKNSPILTKIGMHIDKTSDYYHAKFYQNRTTFSDDKLPQSCRILIKFCVVIFRSLVCMHTNFRQNLFIFWPLFFHGGRMHDSLKFFFSPKSYFLSISLFEMSDFFKKLCTCNLEVPFSL